MPNDIYDQILDEQEAPAAAAPVRDVYDDVLDEQDAQDQGDLNTALNAGLGKAPDSYAKVLYLSERLKMQPQQVEPNLPEAERLTRLQDINPVKLSQDYPRTAEAYKSADFASVAHDDVDSLTAFEKLVRGVGTPLPAHATYDRTAHPSAQGYVSSVKVGASRGLAGHDAGYLNFKREFGGNAVFGMGEFTAEDEATLARADRVSRETGGADNTPLGYVLANTAEVIGGMAPAVGQGIKTGGMLGVGFGAMAAAASGPGAAITAPVAALAGGAIGFTKEMVLDSFYVEAGQAARELRQVKDYAGRGLDDTTVKGAALAVGAVNAGLEFAGIKVLGKVFLPGMMDKLSMGALRTELLASPTLAAAFASFGQKMLAGTSVETVQEVTQEITNIVAGWAARAVDGGAFPEPTWTGIAERLGEVALKTASGTFLLAGAGSTPHFVVEAQRASEAKDNKLLFDALADNASNSKLRARMPGKLQEVYDQIAAGTPVESVYIKADKLVTLFQGDPKRPESWGQVLAALPSVRDELETALASDGFLSVPVGEFAAKIAGTNAYQAIANDVKLRPNDFTVSQAKDWEANYKVDFDREMALAQQDADAAAQLATPTEQVQTTVTQMLRNAGVSNDVSTQYASLWGGFFSSIGARAGIAPDALLQRYAPMIQGEAQRLASTQAVDRLDLLIDRARTGKRPTDDTLYGPGLLDFLAERGGLQDLGGELAARDLNKRHLGTPFAKRTVREDGADFEAAASAAVDAGYFTQQDADQAVSLEGLLLGGIDRELAGQPVRSTRSRNDALLSDVQQSDDLAEYLNTVGVDLQTATNEEIKTALREASASLPARAQPDGPVFDQPVDQADADPWKDWPADWPRTLADDDLLLAPTIDKPDREALRETEIARILEHAKPVEGRKPIAWVMGGGGGSGKGAVLARLIADGEIPGVDKTPSVVHIDPDAVKDHIPEFGEIKDAGDSRGAATVQRESSLIANAAFARAQALQTDLVLDRTMKDQAEGLAMFQSLKDAGYEVRLIGVSLDTAEALRRADKRAKRSWRYVPPEFLIAAHRGFAAAWRAYLSAVDSARLYDNNGAAPVHISQADAAGSVATTNAEAYDRFVQKAQENLDERETSNSDRVQEALRPTSLSGEGSGGGRRAGGGDVSGSGDPGSPGGLRETAPGHSGVQRGEESGGAPSGLTELFQTAFGARDQVTNSPEFQRWFGDSKAVDANGKPLVLYHGTGSSFDAFRTSSTGEFGPAIYTTDSAREAGEYGVGQQKPGVNVMPLYVSLQHPYTKGVDAFWKEFGRDDGDDAAVARAKAAGYDGVIAQRPDEYYDNATHAFVARGDVLTHYVVFDPNQVKSATGNSGAFNPQSPSILEQKSRGSIQLPGDGAPGPVAINLFRAHDLSTFLHESGHFFLHVFGDVAAQEGAAPDLVADYANALTWLGVQPGQALTTEQHEQFARGFEAYLFEGRAPAVELESIFARFRSWLVAVYRDIKRLDVALTPEIRAVFDRLLASEEQIEAARAAMYQRPMFEDAQAMGVTSPEFEIYRKNVTAARDKAMARMSARTLADLRTQRTDEYMAMRVLTEAAVTLEINADRRYRALHLLQHGRFADGPLPDGVPAIKLDRAALVQMYGGPEILKRLPGAGTTGVYRRAGGIHPDAAAALLDFDSGDALVMALVNLEPPAKAIDTIVDQRMRDTFGDVLRDGSLEAEGLAAVHSDEQLQALSAEADALNRREGRRIPPLSVVKQMARETIAQAVITKGASVGQYTVAERRAARNAERALIKGDFAEAARQKRIQVLNHALATESIQARADLESGLKLFDKFNRPGPRAALAPEYLDQIDNLLERFDFRRAVSQRAIAKRQSLLDWVQGRIDAGFHPAIDPRLLREASRQSYKTLSVEAFRGLVDAVKSIAHLGSLKQRLLTAREKADFLTTVDELVAVSGAHPDYKDVPLPYGAGPFQPLRDFVVQANADHLRPEFEWKFLDQTEANGPWWSTLFKPLADAEAASLVLRTQTTRSLMGIFGKYTRLERAGWYRDRQHFPSLGTSLNKTERLALALNWGNDVNRSRIMTGHGQYGWNPNSVQEVLDTLDARDWQFVQGVWDLIDTLWPAASELNLELSGVRPEKVEALPFQTKFGELRGGYYPLKYDARLSERVARRDEKAAVQETLGGNWARAQTRQGHLKARVENVTLPVLLDLSVIAEHLENVIHDVTHRKAVIDVNRLIHDGRVETQIKSVLGTEFYKRLNPWLLSIASDRAPPAPSFIDGTLRHARHGMTVLSMGWKVSTAILQPLGYTQSVTLIGERWALRGLKDFYGKPWQMKKTVQFVTERSPMMANRMTTFDRDVREFSKTLGVRGVFREIEATYFMGVGLGDLAVSMPTWLGAYAKGLEDFKNDEAKAIDYADSSVRMAQGSGSPKDLPAVQRGTEANKIYTMFYSYFSVLNNMLRRTKRQTRSVVDAPRAALSYLYLVAIPAVLGEMLLGHGPDDDEEWLAWAAKKAAVYPLMSYVIVRDVASAMSSGFDYRMSPVADAFKALIDTTNSASEGEFDERFFKTGVSTLGVALHLPTRQAWITGDYLSDYFSGEVDEFSLYDALVTGHRE